MRAIDTNILARFILNDDPHQSATAQALLQEPAFIPLSVLMETGWLLASRYRLPPGTISEILLAAIDLPTVVVANDALARWAIARFAKGADFADMLHLVASAGSDSFATFDRRIADQAGPDTPVPIETLR